MVVCICRNVSYLSALRFSISILEVRSYWVMCGGANMNISRCDMAEW